MKYSFEDLQYEYNFAHEGSAPIFFSRVKTLSPDFAFNFLDFVKMPVSSDIGKHTHTSDNQEIYIVISGTGKMIVNGTTYFVKEGDVIVNPIGGTHQLMNIGDEEIRLVIIEMPLTNNQTLPTPHQ